MKIVTTKTLEKSDISEAIKQHMYVFGSVYDKTLREPDGSYLADIDVSDEIDYELWKDYLTTAANAEIESITNAIAEGIERAGGTITMSLKTLMHNLHDPGTTDDTLPEPLEDVARHIGQLFSWYDRDTMDTETSTFWHPAQRCKEDPDCWVCTHMCSWKPDTP